MVTFFAHTGGVFALVAAGGEPGNVGSKAAGLLLLLIWLIADVAHQLASWGRDGGST